MIGQEILRVLARRGVLMIQSLDLHTLKKYTANELLSGHLENIYNNPRYHLLGVAHSTARRFILCSTAPLKNTCPTAYLGRAHNSPLVFAPVHTENFVSMALQGSPCLHYKLSQRLHTLCHLMNCKQLMIREPFIKALPWKISVYNAPGGINPWSLSAWCKPMLQSWQVANTKVGGTGTYSPDKDKDEITQGWIPGK